ncbi:kinase-like protein [Colletotrichum graminicola]|nr:kinase-like protein [Colletotrichum graminicola]
MSRHNILVDVERALTAVVNRERVSALPLYVTCQYPPFL